MKIAIGYKVKNGPWGGGNRFVAALSEALIARGDQIVHSLDQADIDIVLIVDPRARNPNVPFTPGDVLRFLLRHPRALVVHRINECDERKATRTMNARLRLANYVADHTVFIGKWLKELDVWRRETPYCVIHNGADTRLFHSLNHRPWKRTEKFKLVTHHWSAHAFKGFDVYAQIDGLIGQPAWQDRLDFTYIGNMPEGFQFRHACHLKPLNGKALADELQRHHGYITGSLNEPAGMHHIEGALCGLPLIFRNSGALPEYCGGFGEMFEGTLDVETALERMLARYEAHRASLSNYMFTAQSMCQNYMTLFDELHQNGAKIAADRRLGRNPFVAAALQLPL